MLVYELAKLNYCSLVYFSVASKGLKHFSREHTAYKIKWIFFPVSRLLVLQTWVSHHV